MKIGDKVAIYYYHYQTRIFFSIGEYLGTEDVWRKMTHGLVIDTLKKFKVGSTIIYENVCEWESIK